MKQQSAWQTAFVAALLLIALAARAAESPLWIADGKPTPQALGMIGVLHQAEAYGLGAADYELNIDAIDLQSVMAGNSDVAMLARFDEVLTRSVSRFVRHVTRGRVTPQAAGFHLPAERAPVAIPEALHRLASSSDLTATIDTLEPRPLPYRMLKKALARYRELALQPTLTLLPALPARSITTGDAYSGKAQLRDLLIAVGDLTTVDAQRDHDEPTLDAGLVEALKRFQQRHGLIGDGVLGAATFRALTVPMDRRVRQIELALERWRWMAAMNRPDIVIDIPHYTLYALPRTAGEAMLEMPVIVGRKNDRTPVFTAQIKEVIFQPFWDVPSSIARQELLPKARQDLTYFERHHFEIVRGGGDDAIVVPTSPESLEALAKGNLRLRQRPGPDNALGPVKFVLPNPYEIRLHGTPEQHLFKEARRAFSHGCIRVSDPAALAEYVLANASEEWTAAAIATALCDTQTRYVSLRESVRIVVFYTTATATQSRGVLFSEDIYGHDSRLEKLLARPFDR